MHIYIQDEVLKFDNDPSVIIEIINTINKHLEKKGLQLSYLIIDDAKVSSKYHSYFSDNIKSIEKVEVIPMGISDLIIETILTTNEYVDNAIPLISELAEEFYKKPNENTWMKLSGLFEGIQWLIESLSKIDTINNLSTVIGNYEIWNEYVQEISQLNTIIPELERVIKSTDIISIGDLLLYEIIPIFGNMSKKLELLNKSLGDYNVS